MKSFLRALVAVIAGMALAFVLVVAVELFSAVVRPIPPELNGNIPEHVRRYPDWILGVVVLAWSATITAATWAASRIGNRLAGAVVAVLLAWGLIFNLTMLPYAMWFRVVMLGMCPVACLIGIKYGRQRRSPAGSTEAMAPSHR